jgi:hypothetical protein
MRYANKNATVSGFGSAPYARVVRHLTQEERDAIRAGEEVRITDCPPYQGITERKIVEIKGRFYTRMP